MPNFSYVCIPEYPFPPLGPFFPMNLVPPLLGKTSQGKQDFYCPREGWTQANSAVIVSEQVQLQQLPQRIWLPGFLRFWAGGPQIVLKGISKPHPQFWHRFLRLWQNSCSFLHFLVVSCTSCLLNGECLAFCGDKVFLLSHFCPHRLDILEAHSLHSVLLGLSSVRSLLPLLYPGMLTAIRVYGGPLRPSYSLYAPPPRL